MKPSLDKICSVDLAQLASNFTLVEYVYLEHFLLCVGIKLAAFHESSENEQCGDRLIRVTTTSKKR